MYYVVEMIRYSECNERRCLVVLCGVAGCMQLLLCLCVAVGLRFWRRGIRKSPGTMALTRSCFQILNNTSQGIAEPSFLNDITMSLFTNAAFLLA